MLVLLETPAGFGLFRVMDEGKLSKVDNIAKQFSSLESASELCVEWLGNTSVYMRRYHPFFLPQWTQKSALSGRKRATSPMPPASDGWRCGSLRGVPPVLP